jgi:hypothetical protein
MFPRAKVLAGAVICAVPVAAAGLLAAPGTAGAGPVPTYSTADWGTLSSAPNGVSTVFLGSPVNANGDAVGLAYLADNVTYHAVLYKGGTLTDLGVGGTNGPVSSQPHGVNDSDTVVGALYSPIGEFTQPVEWSSTGQMKFIGSEGLATAVNDSGVVVGYSSTATDGFSGAMEWLDSSGHQVNLGTLPGAAVPDAAAIDINNAGEIVGFAYDSHDMQQAVIFSGGSAQPLAELAGSTGDGAAAVSQSGGYIVGDARTPDGSTEAVQFSPGPTAVNLGSLPGESQTQALAVNSSGMAVGASGPVEDGPGQVAVLFDGGNVIDLNSLLPANSGWTLEQADGINDNGQIVGWGVHDGNVRAFEMTPALTGVVTGLPPLGGLQLALNPVLALVNQVLITLDYSLGKLTTALP